MNEPSGVKSANRRYVAAGAVGFLIELTAIVLLASDRISASLAIPLLAAGMVGALVPTAVLAKRR